MFTIDLAGKNGLIFGVANHRSVAWAIAQILHQTGMNLVFAYQNERVRGQVEELTATLGGTTLIECDVTNELQIQGLFDQIKTDLGTLSVVVHSIAFANRGDLGGSFSHTKSEGFHTAMEVSAYSLLPIVRHAAPLMGPEGGNIVTMSFQASERVFPGYNIMGTAKAALENEVRQLAAEYGSANIRINALSAGPLDTLSSRAISSYREMKSIHAERSPLRRSVTHNDVARTGLYLCSELSSGVTGAVIPVDCGYSIMGI